MSFIKCVVGLGLLLGVVACGGGGGSGGTPLSGTGASTTTTTTVVVAKPTMTMSLVDAAGTAITTHALSQTQTQYLKVVLKDSAGVVVPYTRVTVSLDSTIASLVPTSGAQLTNALGEALIRVTPTSVTSDGPVLATATATVEATVLTQTYEVQISSGTVTLSVITVSPTSVQKFQSLNVSVDVSVNGVQATSNSVSVNFTSLCGTVSPTSSLVDYNGRATAVIQTNDVGSCTVVASANGVSQSAPFTVTAAPTTGIQFVSASPNLLYQSGSVGVTTSIVKFKVIDSVAAGVFGQSVTATLSNTDGGINFCGSPSVNASGADGTVSFSVCSGTLPATVQVHAKLTATPTIFTDSNLLTVQTGLPTQRFFDISGSQFNFYAGGHFTSKFNGNSVDISVFAADRQGNPVPNGTNIVFVSEGGQINSSGSSSCVLTNGRCTVQLFGQDYRPMGSSAAGGDPRPGRVTVLAYTDGEESYVDANFNNRYDSGELIEDLGTHYLDKDESGAFVAAYTNLITGTNEGEFTYPLPTGVAGSTGCPINSNQGLSVASTCNGTWDGLTKVRRQIVIVFSGGEIGQPSGYDASIPSNKRTEMLSRSTSAVSVRLADLNGNPLPANASIAAEVIAPTGNTCSATLLGAVIGSTTEPTVHTATMKNCVGGGVETVRFKVTVASGGSSTVSAFDVVIP